MGGGQRERGWRAGCGDVQRAPVVRLFMFSWRMHVLCYLEQETKSQNHLWCRLKKNRNAIKSPCLVYKEMLEPAVRAAVDSILVVAGRAGLGFPVKWCGRQIRRFALRGTLGLRKSDPREAIVPDTFASALDRPLRAVDEFPQKIVATGSHLLLRPRCQHQKMAQVPRE